MNGDSDYGLIFLALTNDKVSYRREMWNGMQKSPKRLLSSMCSPDGRDLKYNAKR